MAAGQGLQHRAVLALPAPARPLAALALTLRLRPPLRTGAQGGEAALAEGDGRRGGGGARGEGGAAEWGQNGARAACPPPPAQHRLPACTVSLSSRRRPRRGPDRGVGVQPDRLCARRQRGVGGVSIEGRGSSAVQSGASMGSGSRTRRQSRGREKRMGGAAQSAGERRAPPGARTARPAVRRILRFAAPPPRAPSGAQWGSRAAEAERGVAPHRGLSACCLSAGRREAEPSRSEAA